MKTYVTTLLIIAAVVFILGVITQLVGHPFFLKLTANALNGITQSLLLFSITIGVCDYFCKKE